MTPFTLILIALCLTACQSAQDREYNDLQRALELTQPSKTTR